jgi:L-ascorbate metabolism protein UlaG (beta-lactamase superfamily)
MGPFRQPFKYAMSFSRPPNRRERLRISGASAEDDGFAVRRKTELTRLMRLTKFEHACLRIDENGETLLIDPGSFTTPLDDLTGVVAVVITHEHPDHWTPEHLDRILRAAPGTPILAPQGVATAVAGHDITVVAPGDTISVGRFTLRFFGGTHEVIHSSLPIVQNVGVLVNDELYYPGDSYAVPEDVEVDTLAAPLGAPWLRVGDAMDFVLAVAPRRSFGTHDMTLSVIGKGMHRARLKWATEQGGGEFFELEPGDTLDL